MNKIIVVRGGGDLATGTIVKLYKCGFSVLITECQKPTAIRRKAAFCEAVYEGSATVEGITARLIHHINEIEGVLAQKEIPIIVMETMDEVATLAPVAVIDAILAKKNLGTTIHMAPITIALGPGFTAGVDVGAVIETQRGHNLGRVIYDGTAIPNTGIPGAISGYGKERVIHAPATGTIHTTCAIGDIVSVGMSLGNIGDTPILATLDGVLRGIIRDGFVVKKGFKIADIDPRIEEVVNCVTISDKARCIAGGVVEALLEQAVTKGITLS